jgi:hypothetical protein
MNKKILIISAVVAGVLILISTFTLIKVYSLENTFNVRHEKINCMQEKIGNINRGKIMPKCDDNKECDKNIELNNKQCEGCSEEQTTTNNTTTTN